MNYYVYVNPGRAHYPEDFIWTCKDRAEAVALSNWLIRCGLNAQPLDKDAAEALGEFREAT